jgi:hypothetical protein
MSRMEQLRSMAAEMDDLVSRQEFSAAADCAAQLAEWLRNCESQPSAEAALLFGEGMRAIETARRKICVARTRMAECLLRLGHTAEYCGPRAGGEHTWTVEG